MSDIYIRNTPFFKWGKPLNPELTNLPNCEYKVHTGKASRVAATCYSETLMKHWLLHFL